jgi:hypothetical protein
LLWKQQQQQQPVMLGFENLGQDFGKYQHRSLLNLIDFKSIVGSD